MKTVNFYCQKFCTAKRFLIETLKFLLCYLIFYYINNRYTQKFLLKTAVINKIVQLRASYSYLSPKKPLFINSSRLLN